MSSCSRLLATILADSGPAARCGGTSAENGGQSIKIYRRLKKPVEQVSWNEAVKYCQKLTERESAARRITAQQAYRLQTEAEWEYAARAGTIGVRHWGLDAVGWYYGNSGNQTHAMKLKAATAWGLYDMMGNVWEWCSDWGGNYLTGSLTDPTGPSSGSGRMNRGGSWNNEARNVRSANRNRNDQGNRNNNLG